MARPGARGLLDRLVGVLEVISCWVLAAMMLLTFVDVVGRYVLGKPVFGATEIISTLLAFLIFTGLGIANARDDHIVVELFDGPLRARAPGLYDCVIHGFSILAMGLISYVLFVQAVEAAHVGSRTVVLEWPLAWITAGIAGLSGLSVATQVLGLLTGGFVRPAAGQS